MQPSQHVSLCQVNLVSIRVPMAVQIELVLADHNPLTKRDRPDMHYIPPIQTGPPGIIRASITPRTYMVKYTHNIVDAVGQMWRARVWHYSICRSCINLRLGFTWLMYESSFRFTKTEITFFWQNYRNLSKSSIFFSDDNFLEMTVTVSKYTPIIYCCIYANDLQSVLQWQLQYSYLFGWLHQIWIMYTH